MTDYRKLRDAGLPAEAAVGIVIGQIATQALAKQIEFLADHGATADELAAHAERAKAELAEWSAAAAQHFLEDEATAEERMRAVAATEAERVVGEAMWAAVDAFTDEFKVEQ